ncbi:exostosin-like 3 [Fusarium beomiforme]|uniref:Exostosin-like 3 n=1 Tax=Fusarium beomiforme TaxID=44412 RepID=A0A9P5DRY6_9HYPO|nr:exostosin-like 3 [Fusarium beomiforme]
MFPVSQSKSFRHRFLEPASLYLHIFSSQVSRLLVNKAFIFTIVASIFIVGLTCADVSQNLLPVRLLPQQVTPASTKPGSPQDIWNTAKARYSHLDDDKFTIAMLTYRRPKELNYTLSVLLEEKIPSLHEIVIIWGDVDDVPPTNFTSKHGVPVRYRRGLQDSLNEKLRPDPDFKTQAILLTDDDVYYRPSDLEFVFQTWRKFGRYRLTGALARCYDTDAEGHYNYNFCPGDKRDEYSMILTNLCFSHISFMDYYWSDDSTMSAIREYVDKHFNCEDIAMNYVQGLLTGQGPLLVTGWEGYANLNPPSGISTKPGHLEARSKCLNDFVKIFKSMPLVNETAHIKRGVNK